MTFRTATNTDIAGILTLYKQLNPEDEILSAEKASSIWNRINASSCFRYFVALENDKVVSSCNISIIPNFTRNGRSYAIIENVITDQEFRNRGIGGKIMRMAIDYARLSECYKVVLMSNIKRKDAHAFYKKIGFDGDSKKGFEMRFE